MELLSCLEAEPEDACRLHFQAALKRLAKKGVLCLQKAGRPRRPWTKALAIKISEKEKERISKKREILLEEDEDDWVTPALKKRKTSLKPKKTVKQLSILQARKLVVKKEMECMKRKRELFIQKHLSLFSPFLDESSQRKLREVKAETETG